MSDHFITISYHIEQRQTKFVFVHSMKDENVDIAWLDYYIKNDTVHFNHFKTAMNVDVSLPLITFDEILKTLITKESSIQKIKINPTLFSKVNCAPDLSGLGFIRNENISDYLIYCKNDYRTSDIFDSEYNVNLNVSYDCDDDYFSYKFFNTQIGFVTWHGYDNTLFLDWHSNLPFPTNTLNDIVAELMNNAEVMNFDVKFICTRNMDTAKLENVNLILIEDDKRLYSL